MPFFRQSTALRPSVRSAHPCIKRTALNPHTVYRPACISLHAHSDDDERTPRAIITPFARLASHRQSRSLPRALTARRTGIPPTTRVRPHRSYRPFRRSLHSRVVLGRPLARTPSRRPQRRGRIRFFCWSVAGTHSAPATSVAAATNAASLAAKYRINFAEGLACRAARRDACAERGRVEQRARAR